MTPKFSVIMTPRFYSVLGHPSIKATALVYKSTAISLEFHFPLDLVFFQLHLYGTLTCPEWIGWNQQEKFEEIGQDLSVFIQQRCGCVFPPSSITSPQFTCHSDAQHVVYRASVGVSTVGVSREELEAALEEWPRTHRSILLQGQRLSVEQNCPVIINSLEDEGECELTTTSVTVSLTTFLLTMAAVFIVSLLGAVALIVFIQLMCRITRHKRKLVIYVHYYIMPIVSCT